MGASASRGRDNESLIDKLVESGLSLPTEVERAMRLVDRGEYFSEKSPRAYMDLAWISGSLHLSAPNIYVAALKNLDISPGQSFLNVGSGSGYLSTIVGLLLGYNGVNHGIELSAANVDFAKRRLQTFLAQSDAPLERDFCVPHFVHGNIFELVSPPLRTPLYFHDSLRGDTGGESSEEDGNDMGNGEQQMASTEGDSYENANGAPLDSSLEEAVCSTNHNQADGDCHSNGMNMDPPPSVDTTRAISDQLLSWPLYDRIYVGAAIRNRAHLQCILRLLNIGGVLIAPVQDEFVKITRTGENRITRVDLLSVSFAPLILPPTNSSALVRPPPPRELPTLRKLSGRVLRSAIRSWIKQRHNGLPTLGRLTEVETDVQKKKRRNKAVISDASSVSPIAVDAEECNPVDQDHSSSESSDLCSDGTFEEHQAANGFIDGISDSSWSGADRCPTSDQSQTSSSETRRRSGSMARLLHHLVVRSRLSAAEAPVLPDSEASTPLAGQRTERVLDESADRNTPDGSRILLFSLARDGAPSETQTNEDSGEHNQQLRLRVAETLMAAFRNSGTDSDGRDDPEGTQGNEGAQTHPEDDDETRYAEWMDGERPSRSQRKQKRRQREFRYNPPSYRFRDEMRKIMQEELHLPIRIIEDVFSL
ncbi:unnamed protein product [Dicrocoelium dendriticum]|nr:unnamed protein product [Dicrocoelium dendriticum]